MNLKEERNKFEKLFRDNDEKVFLIILLICKL